MNIKYDYVAWVRILVLIGVLSSMVWTYLSIKWHEHKFHNLQRRPVL